MPTLKSKEEISFMTRQTETYLRDQFAMHIVQGLSSKEGVLLVDIPSRAYNLAQGMLEERKKYI